MSRATRNYWLDRIYQCPYDSYCGVPFAKFPEDLRAYEHLLWHQRADTVIEIGTMYGGSALWFRDRLRVMQSYGRIDKFRVISIDVDTSEASPLLNEADPDYEATITLLSADVRDPALPELVAKQLPPGARAVVVEDSAHVYETTKAALDGFARFVPRNGFFIVEDGYVDIESMRPSPAVPRGVLPAVREWLASEEGCKFRVERGYELYGMTQNPSGFLKRVDGSS